jgi:nucleoside-diphosphate kinase
MGKKHSRVPGTVLDGIDWSRFSVVLVKPDCLRRGLVDEVLGVVAQVVDIVTCERVIVEDWQIFVHYWDILVDKDWFTVDVVDYLRRAYIGQPVVVALVRGSDQDTPARVRALIGHYNPAAAAPGTIRGRFGADGLEASRREGRLIENVIHASDDAATVCRDFGTWFGANRHDLLDQQPGRGQEVSHV